MAEEFVVFRLEPDAALKDFQAAIDETTALLKAQHGFISRTGVSLSQLQVLWLFSNRLTQLPTQLGQLSPLRELKVGNNQLTSLLLSRDEARRLPGCLLSRSSKLLAPLSLHLFS
jgi:hypothetical protein